IFTGGAIEKAGADGLDARSCDLLPPESDRPTALRTPAQRERVEAKMAQCTQWWHNNISAYAAPADRVKGSRDDNEWPLPPVVAPDIRCRLMRRRINVFGARERGVGLRSKHRLA